ncbi:hypothetical protein ACYULU_00450 [Breznakiellaceae bacterium SP9]
MQSVKAYYDGSVFIPTMPVSAKKNRTVIVTFLDDEIAERENELEQKHYSNIDWLNEPWKIAGFKPLAREAVYDRTFIGLSSS